MEAYILIVLIGLFCLIGGYFLVRRLTGRSLAERMQWATLTKGQQMGGIVGMTGAVLIGIGVMHLVSLRNIHADPLPYAIEIGWLGVGVGLIIGIVGRVISTRR